jgi:hypothetical protein
MLPHIIDQDLGRADLKAALSHGPIAFIAVAKNGVPAVVGRWLALLLFFLTVNTVVAYASWHAFSVLNSGLRHMPLRIPFGHVARVVFATASLAYAGAAFQESVWHGRPWSSFVLTCVDAVIYAGISAVIFGLFWPM